MTTVYIPTRARYKMLEDKVLPNWMAQSSTTDIFLVCEPHEAAEYVRLANKPEPCLALVLPKDNQGVNYARNYIVQHAAANGSRRIIMADDDIYPHPASLIERLFEWDGINTLGIGCMTSYYGLMFGNHTIKDEDRPLMSKGALGKRLFSLNIPRVMACGNFDPKLHSGWGDDELVRQGMALLQSAWYVHAGVWGVSVANRYTEGGINDFHGEDLESRERGQERSHRIIYDRWGPRYVSDPGKKMTFRWQKLMDYYVPDWRARIDWEKK